MKSKDSASQKIRREAFSYSLVNLAFPLAILFFLTLFLWQYQYVFLYQDDYGYASLSYAYVQADVAGQSFSLPQLFNYLIEHYKIWGGRILCFGLEILLLRGGLWLTRIFMSISTLIIFLAGFKISRNNSAGKLFITKKPETSNTVYSIAKSILVLASGVATFGLYAHETYRTGLYWFTAAILYTFPIAVFLLVIIGQYYLINNDQLSKTRQRTILFSCALGSFIAAFSQEQVAFMVVVYLFLDSLLGIIQKRQLQLARIIPFVTALIGTVILYLAPGNNVRMGTSPEFYNLSIIDRILKNFPVIIKKYLSSENRLFVILVFILLIVVDVRFIKSKSKFSKFTSIHLTLLLPTFIYYLFFAKELPGLLFANRGFLIVTSLLASTLIVYSFISLCVLLVKAKQEKVLILFISAIASQAVMLNTPYIVERMMIPFYFIIGIVFMTVVGDSLYAFRITKVLAVAGCLIIIIFGLSGMISLRQGYKGNAPIMNYNDYNLRLAHDEIKAGVAKESVILKKLPEQSRRFAADQPYAGEDFMYIESYIKEFYDLPQLIKLDWRDSQ